MTSDERRMHHAIMLIAVCCVLIKPVAALPIDVRVWQRAPELQASLVSVERNGKLSPEDSERLVSFVKLEVDELTAVVAYVVGESEGDDAALCDLLATLPDDGRFAHGYAALALLKKDLRGESDSAKLEAFRALLADPNRFARMEAAKEIASIDASQGTEVLCKLATTDRDDVVQGAAAKVLYEMGRNDMDEKRWMVMGFEQYIQLTDIIEGRHWREYDAVWKGLSPELVRMLSELRKTGALSDEELKDLVEYAKSGATVASVATLPIVCAVYSELRDEYLPAREALEGGLAKEYLDSSLPYAFIRMALLKGDLRDKPVAEQVETFEPLTKDVNPYLRAEAGKEIARIDPEKGKALLKRLLDTDESRIVQGESARILDKMGEPTPFGAAHRHRWDVNYHYTAILKIVEGEPLW